MTSTVVWIAVLVGASAPPTGGEGAFAGILSELGKTAEAVRRIAMAARKDAVVARNVHYTGRVQGVGFRATTVGLSRGRNVVGWVKNLPDGRVELWVEGKADAVEGFLAAVRQHFARNLTDERVDTATPMGRHKVFTIEY